MELLAVGGAAGRIAALDGGGLGRRELAREPADGGGGHPGQRLRPLRGLGHPVGGALEIGPVGRARGRARGQVRLVKAHHAAVEEGLVVPSLADDHLRHRDQHGGVRARADGDVLVGDLPARPRHPRVHADHPDATRFGALEILHGAGAEVPVPGAPAPEQHEPRVDVVAGLAAGELAVGGGAVGVADGEHLGLVGEIGPELGAAAQPVEQPGQRGPVVERGGAPGARAVEDGGGAVGVEHRRSAAATASRASSHEMRSNPPPPRGPTRRSGCSKRSG